MRTKFICDNCDHKRTVTAADEGQIVACKHCDNSALSPLCDAAGCEARAQMGVKDGGVFCDEHAPPVEG